MNFRRGGHQEGREARDRALHFVALIPKPPLPKPGEGETDLGVAMTSLRPGSTNQLFDGQVKPLMLMCTVAVL